ncbi:3-hydroxybutyrate dehydrogenase [Desulfurella multipotens]|uniref:3-hydroxybutyrate dehydrogenase n=1 Tax=Desulfurella multipotens TaxID=79269 RepID=UPI000CBE90F4|nr:3-hydroxybutyrate dehydrogenase [Desulfurella multipotens]PMP65569.1 MAG: D-beta-hydroxybutyrate dehydrogenase [Desulfurella multipotens]
MLKDKVCIVTGAASGIGLSIAQSFAKEGANVIMSDINQASLSQESDKIKADYFASDLSTQKGCKDLVDYVLKKYFKVDILVNNAGIQHVSPIENFPEDKWNFIISLMLTAPFLLTKYVWPSMKAQKWGRIININSVHGIRASEFKVAYISAKHGLSGLTKVAALEGAPYGITVNSICPSYVRTPLVDNQIDDQAKTHGIPREKVIEEIMLKKAAIKKLIEPDDIAEVAKFLCTPAADYITGSMMTIDCGWSAT